MPLCSLWSNWTDCKANGTSVFTFQTQERKCWYNMTDMCAQDGPVTIETVSKVCKRWCRQDYIVSKHGFCFKYHTSRRNRTDAEIICRSDERRHKERRIDIIDLAPDPSAIWIDGRRQQPYGPWSFYKGSDPIKNGIIKWHYGRPKTSLCLFTYIRNGLISLHDFDCNNTLKYVCEIRMD